MKSENWGIEKYLKTFQRARRSFEMAMTCFEDSDTSNDLGSCWTPRNKKGMAKKKKKKKKKLKTA
jgi:hypothetical protein